MFWLAIAALLAAPQEPVTIRVPVRLVTVPTLVFANDGRCISGLEARDFQVLDNGRPTPFRLDTGSQPPSVAVVVQVSTQVRQYLPFISKVGSAVEDLLVGETGQSALVTYEDFVTVQKDFSAGGMREAFRKIREGGKRARMIDAAIQGVDLLAHQPPARSRVLLLIGQAVDHGSTAKLEELEERAERENVTIYAMALPQFNKAFVEDTFWLDGPAPRDSGFRTGVNLGKLAPTLTQEVKAGAKVDPFTLLTHNTGGTQLHFRSQRALEGAVEIVGAEMRSVYTLSFTPEAGAAGYHRIKVEVNVPGATAYARQGYRLQ